LRYRATAALLRQAGVPADRHEELLDRHVRRQRPLPRVAVDLALEDGARLDGLEVIHTPGHSPGHVCLAVGDVLLCGDHILPRTIPQQWPESIRPYAGLGHYIESLDKIRRREGFRWALGGHEPPIDDVAKRIDDIGRSQTRRLERLLDVLRAADHPLTVWEASQAIYAQSQGFYVLLTLMDTAARTEYLHQRGRLTIANLDQVESDDSVPWRYRPA
jgi:glyoxylase-like metal-dependent hydrolase (beta-lactamase superfamily II)